MAAALLGYFGSMVAALVGILMLSNAFLRYFPPDEVKSRPHLRPVIAQALELDASNGRSATSAVPAPSNVAATKPAAVPRTAAARAQAEKKKRLKIARYRQRQMLAREREQRQDTAALGYEQESSFAPNFGPFGTGRY